MRGKFISSLHHLHPVVKKNMNGPYHDSEGNLIDYYELLGVKHDAGREAVKTAFRILIKQYHPDTGGEGEIEFLDRIIRGYRILSDTAQKSEYDRFLHEIGKRTPPEPTTVPKKRIRYSASLKEMLKIRLLPKGLKRKDILYHLGQDIEILVTEDELRNGARAYVELPSRMPCPLCMGQTPDCHFCHGVGRIHTTSHLEVSIPPGTIGDTFIDVDLMKVRPDRFTSFRARGIRIRITLLDKAYLESL